MLRHAPRCSKGQTVNLRIAVLIIAERSVEMQFKQGASVVTVDGKEAGHIKRVVIDPESKEITHLVIQQGLLQKKDKVVPIAVITIGPEGQLTAHIKSDELALLPDFEEERYSLADEGRGEDVPLASVPPPYLTG